MNSKEDSKDMIDNMVLELTEILNLDHFEPFEEIEIRKMQHLTSTLIIQYVKQLNYLIENNKSIFFPIDKKSFLSQTEIIVFVDNLLRATQLELFEIQMWRSMSSY